MFLTRNIWPIIDNPAKQLKSTRESGKDLVGGKGIKCGKAALMGKGLKQSSGVDICMHYTNNTVGFHLWASSSIINTKFYNESRSMQWKEKENTYIASVKTF